MGEKLTCAEVRRWDLVQYLESLGHAPQKISRSEYWYLSPLRQERTPSFKVDRRLNLWYDHGLGVGGTLIDFGLLYYRCSVGELLRKLAFGAPLSLSFHPPLSSAYSRQAGEKIKVTSVGALESDALKAYLAHRKIAEPLAAAYCREVHFTLHGKAYVALGFPNNSGGWELRNASFKGSTSPKDLTLLEGGRGTVAVFEGFFSFLSYLQLAVEKKVPETSYLVLNSLALLDRTGPVLQGHQRVHLYLDRDEAGRKATQRLLACGLSCRDRSHGYRHHKDLNELLMAGRTSWQRGLRPGRSP